MGDREDTVLDHSREQVGLNLVRTQRPRDGMRVQPGAASFDDGERYRCVEEGVNGSL
jgi:hypothetical protein